MNGLAFDTRSIAAPRRFDAFYAAIADQVGRMTPAPPPVREAFQARVTGLAQGGRRIALIAATGHDAARGAPTSHSIPPRPCT